MSQKESIKLLLLLSFGLISFSAHAIITQMYRLEGTIGGKLPIVIELDEYDDGFFAGRYAYKTTIEEDGEGECSWIDINPSYENPATVWSLGDCQLNSVGSWCNVEFKDGKHLTATMKDNNAATYSVSANVVSKPSATDSLAPLFKQHLGDFAFDFGMFRNQRVNCRFRKLMPHGNFDLMYSFYETQTPIEYIGGMFWASGFKAHQCCNPAVLWAYDSYTNAFYVWVRYEGKDYWWSESGELPYKFRELVNSKF